jgi:hypothetical protein
LRGDGAGDERSVLEDDDREICPLVDRSSGMAGKLPPIEADPEIEGYVWLRPSSLPVFSGPPGPEASPTRGLSRPAGSSEKLDRNAGSVFDGWTSVETESDDIELVNKDKDDLFMSPAVLDVVRVGVGVGGP